MLERLGPNVFYDPVYITRGVSRELTAEVSGWTTWRAAHAGRYKDDQLVESSEIRDLRDVHVSAQSFVDDRQLRIPEAIGLAETAFGIRNTRPSRYVVSKYVSGCHIKPHTDTDFYNTARVYTGIFYLNDGYEGGSIFFPRFGLEVKPAEGSLLLFLAEYLHGVRPITAGTRYSVVWFGVVAEPGGRIGGSGGAESGERGHGP